MSYNTFLTCNYELLETPICILLFSFLKLKLLRSKIHSESILGFEQKDDFIANEVFRPRISFYILRMSSISETSD